MKLLKQMLALSALLSILVVISCGDPDPPADPPGKEISDQLTAGTWIPASATGITMDGTPREEWTDFELNFSSNSDFTGGSYSCTGLPEEDVDQIAWKSSGTWDFGGENKDNYSLIVRDDGIEINVIVDVDITDPTGGTLNLSFETVDPNARAEGFYGKWVFPMSIQ